VDQFSEIRDAVVDLIWVPIESVSKVEKLKVWKEDHLVFGDHDMVSIILQLEHKVEDKKAFPQPVKTGDSSRKRWNSLSSRADSVQELQKACCHQLQGWSPGLALNNAQDSGLDKVEIIWRDWHSKVVAAAEEGLGYRVSKKPRPKGWDRVLANILQERNAARKLRNRSVGEERKAAHKVLQALQRKVKQRIRELRDLELRKRNDLLAKAKASNPRQYWSLLKKAAGLSRNTRSIPDEAFVNGLVVKGDLVLKVWQEAFRKLFAADDKTRLSTKLLCCGLSTRWHRKRLRAPRWITSVRN
jgi:hypothetical protein